MNDQSNETEQGQPPAVCQPQVGDVATAEAPCSAPLGGGDGLVESTDSQRRSGVGGGVGGFSVRFDGQLNSHPLHWDIYNLMQEIEKLPASQQQTKVVTMAGELHDVIATLRCIARSNAKMLLTYAEECFPKGKDGKIHFVRAIMESAAEELDEAFNPGAVGRAAGAVVGRLTPPAEKEDNHD